MDTKLYAILKNLGLNKKETDVYLACLELGKSSVIQIAKKAGIKRTTAYNIIESLLERGFLSKHKDRKGQKFLAESPEKILAVLQQSQKDLKQLMPNLLAITGTESEFKPEVKFYQGKDGLNALYGEILNSCQKGDELIGYYAEELASFFPDFVKKRVAKGIKARAIGIESATIREYKKKDKQELRNTKLVSKEALPLGIEKIIYRNNNVAFMSFRGFPFGVIIKSPQIHKAEKAIFELLWKKLPR